MSREAMKQALEALEQIDGAMPFPVGRSAITALRQALANEALDRKAENARELGLDYEPVIDESAAKRIATALGWKPAAQWVGLTDEEIEKCFVITPDQFLKRHIYKRIEQALKEKNNG